MTGPWITPPISIAVKIVGIGQSDRWVGVVTVDRIDKGGIGLTA